MVPRPCDEQWGGQVRLRVVCVAASGGRGSNALCVRGTGSVGAPFVFWIQPEAKDKPALSKSARDGLKAL